MTATQTKSKTIIMDSFMYNRFKCLTKVAGYLYEANYFLALHVGHRGSKIKVKHIAVWRK